MPRLLSIALGVALLAVGSSVRAEAPPDPLRLVPDQADLIIKLEQPRKLLETLLQNPHFQTFLSFELVREFYESTAARRFYQFLAYFEKVLETPRMELLDRLLGGGVVLGVKIGQDPGPALVVIQSRDEALLRRFFQLGRQLVEQELARQESKDGLQKEQYRGLEILRLGKDLSFCLAGSALLISNVNKAVQLAIDQHLDGGKKSLTRVANVQAARKLVGPDPLAWLWLNFDVVKKNQQAKELFAMPRNDAQLTVLFGGLLDVAGRSPFFCAALNAEDHDLIARFRFPSGRTGMPPAIAVHVPPAGQPGARPLLEPRGVLFSSSYYLDLSKFWEYRAKLFNDKQRKALEEFDKSSKPFLAGNSFSKLLTQAGAYQRVVIAHKPSPEYAKKGGPLYPAFAVIHEMREPEIMSRRMDAVLRGAAVLATTQVKLKLAEEKYKGHNIVAYQFPDDVKGNIKDVRLNFSPCFVPVGNQLIVCSKIELCRDLVDLIEKEQKGPSGSGSSASLVSKVYSEGGSEMLESYKDLLFTQAMLGQAVAPDQAAQQVHAFIRWVRGLGVLEVEENYNAGDFCYAVRLKFARQAP